MDASDSSGGFDLGNDGAERFASGTPSPVIHEEEIMPSTSSISVEAGSPSRRVGDFACIVASHPLAEVVGEAAGALSSAAGQISQAATSAIARSLPSNPFVNVDTRLRSLEARLRA